MGSCRCCAPQPRDATNKGASTRPKSSLTQFNLGDNFLDNYRNQVSVPLARLSAQRVTSLYTLMDVAYDSQALRQLERELGHVPMVAINSRGRTHPPTLDAAEKKRFGERTVVERINSRLKDSFGCRSMWAKGHTKVLCHTTFAVLAVSVDALIRLMLCEDPLPRQET